jgi:cell wall-associated NlpC family hydrolase
MNETPLTETPMTSLQLSNLGPLIAASTAWAEDPARCFWLANDRGRMTLASTPLATTPPAQMFANIAKVDHLTPATDATTTARCADLRTPVVEVEWPSGRHQLLLPVSWDTDGAPYEGRPYQLGRFDCYSLVRDWMTRERGITMAPLTDSPARLANQMLTDGAFVTNPEMDRWERVVIPQAGDGILFAMTQDDDHTPGAANHAGVYLGEGRFLHHFANRLSCEADIDAFWTARVAAFMRWKG